MFALVKRFRLRNVRQAFSHDGNDCGAAALASILHHHGHFINVPMLSELLTADLQGIELSALRDYVQSLGISASCGLVRSRSPQALPTPFIAHFDDADRGHYVVVHEATGSGIAVFDPLFGINILSASEFDHRWSGYVLLIETPPTKRSWRRSVSSFRSVLDLVRTHSRMLSLALAVTASTTVISLAAPVLIKLIIQHVFTNSPGMANLLSAAIATFMFAKVAVSAIKRVIVGACSRAIEKDLIQRYVSRMLTCPIRFFENRSVGDLFSRVSDVSLLQSIAGGPLISALVDACVVGVALLFLSSIDLQCSVLLLGLTFTTLVIALVSGYETARQHRASRVVRQVLGNRIIEAIANIRLIKSFLVQHSTACKITAALDECHSIDFDKERWMISVSTVLTLLMSCGTIYILNHGMTLVHSHRLSLGDLILEYGVAGILWSSLETGIYAIMGIHEAKVSLERLEAIDSISSTAEMSPETVPVNVNNPSEIEDSLRFKQISFSYGSQGPEIDDLTFTLGARETLCIIGESGSGKTTLANLIAGLYTPSAGVIEIDDKIIAPLDLALLRRRVAVVFQDGGLISGTIQENIAFGSTKASEEDIVRVAKCCQADSFIRGFRRGYAHQVGVSGAGLSLGQRQRIAIARAVLADRPVLLLDEATSGLDSLTEERLIQGIMHERDGKAMVVITHRLTLARKLDRCLVLNHGKICEEGFHEELRRKGGFYTKLWDATIDDGVLSRETLVGKKARI